ncbi:MAG: hypothetical protein WCE48_01685 [Steroidobacteraceae bacterium]
MVRANTARWLPALLLGVAIVAAAAGCTVTDTKPLAKINPVQAQTQIPQEQLLDVGIRTFDPGIPEALAKDDDALAKKRIFTDVRKAEAKFLPTLLRATLESTGQWGAVRVVPETVQFVDVLVTGRILESTGARLALEISATDSSGRRWIDARRYASEADLGSYKTEAALKARDPFQNVYSQIANDLLAARQKLTDEQRREVQRVTELRFDADLAPQTFAGYVARDAKTGATQVVRLPAQNDPLVQRARRIRERDAAVIDTVNGYYGGFSDQVRDSYGSWRQASQAEIEKEDKARASARTRTALGAVAVLGSIFVPSQCAADNYNCRRIESAARTAGAIGGTAAVLSGIKKYSDARSHAQALREVSASFQAELAPQVVAVEGKTLRLTGSAEEQYREWRQLLKDLYNEETGVAPAATTETRPPAKS